MEEGLGSSETDDFLCQYNNDKLRSSQKLDITVCSNSAAYKPQHTVTATYSISANLVWLLSGF